MKKLLSLLIAICTVMACEHDAYDKGDSSYSYLRADFVEACVGTDRQVSYVLTDNNEQLLLTAPYTADWIQTADTIYRAVLYYSLAGQKAQPVRLSRLSTVSITQRQLFKNGEKTDPLKLESVWLSNSKKYLNLSVILKTGVISDDAEVQKLGMIGDTITTGADGLRTCHLRLFHSQGDVPQYYSQRAYFSVPLSGLQADSLLLQVNTYDGSVTRGFRL